MFYALLEYIDARAPTRIEFFLTMIDQEAINAVVPLLCLLVHIIEEKLEGGPAFLSLNDLRD